MNESDGLNGERRNGVKERRKGREDKREKVTKANK